MSFRIAGLDPKPFLPLFALSEAELAARGIERVVVASKQGAPCRISLDDAEPGEPALLLSHEHQSADTPYRQQGPIFISKTRARFDALGAVPPALARHLLSLRGFNAAGAMIEADVIEGAQAPRPHRALRVFPGDDIPHVSTGRSSIPVREARHGEQNASG